MRTAQAAVDIPSLDPVVFMWGESGSRTVDDIDMEIIEVAPSPCEQGCPFANECAKGKACNDFVRYYQGLKTIGTPEHRTPTRRRWLQIFVEKNAVAEQERFHGNGLPRETEEQICAALRKRNELLEEYDQHSNVMIARQCNVSASVVRNIVIDRRNACAKRPEVRDAINARLARRNEIAEQLEQYTGHALAQQFGVSAHTISRVAARNGLRCSIQFKGKA